MSRHLVTGGAGFIGSALAHRLVREGHEVTVLDRFSRGKQDRIPSEAEIIKGDIRNAKDVYPAVGDADVIWHLAYVQGTQTFYADPRDVIDVALTGIMNVLHAVDEQDLILVSSSEVYQNPPEGMFPTDETVPLSVPDVTNSRYSYGGGKIASELAVLHWGGLRRALVVRPHNIYGPDMGVDHVIPQFALRMADLSETDYRFPIQGSGHETRSFCHIDDCVDGLMRVYAEGVTREVYHLGNPVEEWEIGSLAHKVARCFNRKVVVVPSEPPPGSPVRRKPDISKLRAIGFDPRVSLVAGLPGTVDWYRDKVPA